MLGAAAATGWSFAHAQQAPKPAGLSCPEQDLLTSTPAMALGAMGPGTGQSAGQSAAHMSANHITTSGWDEDTLSLGCCEREAGWVSSDQVPRLMAKCWAEVYLTVKWREHHLLLLLAKQ